MLGHNSLSRDSSTASRTHRAGLRELHAVGLLRWTADIYSVHLICTGETSTMISGTGLEEITLTVEEFTPQPYGPLRAIRPKGGSPRRLR